MRMHEGPNITRTGIKIISTSFLKVYSLAVCWSEDGKIPNRSSHRKRKSMGHSAAAIHTIPILTILMMTKRNRATEKTTTMKIIFEQQQSYHHL